MKAPCFEAATLLLKSRVWVLESTCSAQFPKDWQPKLTPGTTLKHRGPPRTSVLSAPETNSKTKAGGGKTGRQNLQGNGVKTKPVNHMPDSVTLGLRVDAQSLLHTAEALPAIVHRLSKTLLCNYVRHKVL